jgi:hypothetical protein
VAHRVARVRLRSVGFLLLMLLTLLPTSAHASCGTKRPPSYNDISGVLLERYQGYWTAYKGYRAKTFDGSAFWALFSKRAPAVPNTYSQYDLDYQIGTYELKATIAEVVAVLRRDKFFAVGPSYVLVLDTPQEVLSVKRCGAVTELRMYDWGGEDKPTVKIFADLRALVENSDKVKVSPRPKDYPRDASLLTESPAPPPRTTHRDTGANAERSSRRPRQA